MGGGRKTSKRRQVAASCDCGMIASREHVPAVIVRVSGGSKPSLLALHELMDAGSSLSSVSHCQNDGSTAADNVSTRKDGGNV